MSTVVKNIFDSFKRCWFSDYRKTNYFVLISSINGLKIENNQPFFVSSQPMASEDNSWRTTAFRQSVVSKIDEAIQRSGMSTSRNSVDMESHVFQKAKTREEYLGLVARLILHVREMNTKKGQMNGPNPGQGGPGMPDPINALQNLASQGTRNNQMMGMGPGQPGPMGGQNMATNLLQTLNRPGQNLGGLQGLQGQMGQPMPNQIQQMQLNQQGGIPNQMGAQMGGQVNQMNLQNQMGGQMPQQMPPNMNPQMAGQMGPQQVQMQMGGQMGGQMQHMAQRTAAGTPGQGFPGPRNPTPTQFLTQSPTQGSVQSPAAQTNLPNQMVASPALVPSPSQQVGMMGAQRSVGMAPSPSSSLNTPGQAQPTPSPLQDEQAYREKVRQLSKYIEPLRKMIARMGNDGEHVEKLSKMKKLLEILSNPNQRMALETLIKCEVVLEKLDFKRGEGSVGPPVTTHLSLKEHHIFNPLLEACSNNLQSPVINHTMHRTFGPALEALFGPEIKLVPPLKKIKKDPQTQNEIPDALQGEIARLDSRFKVAMNPLKQPGSRSIQLLCYLDDKHLPCVPPISLTIPEEYPKNPPSCHMSPFDYNATQFLKDVQKSLQSRIEHLPKHFSVSQLLTTWEMSVRQACAPTQTPVHAATILMGL